MNDENIYLYVMQEIEDEILNKAFWAKAFALSNGDDNRQKSLYMQLRVKELKQILDDDNQEYSDIFEINFNNTLNHNNINSNHNVWIERLFSWASYNQIPEPVYDKDKEYISGLTRNIDELLTLKELTINVDNLSELPKELFNIVTLETLKILNVDKSEITEIPEEISNLKNLITLCIWSENGYTSKLMKIPTTIKSLKNLKTLSFYGHLINYLPDEVGYLSNLEQLYIQACKLTTLPKTISNLLNLKDIRLQMNSLSSIPKEIIVLNNLQYMDLTDNINLILTKELVSLKSKACTLKTDKHLREENDTTRIIEEKLAAWISDHSSDYEGYRHNISREEMLELEFLNLSGYGYDIPKTINRLKNLKGLSLEAITIKHIPKVIFQLTNLVELYINSSSYKQNSITTILPNEIENLKKLEHFDISSNNLKELPSNISKLKNLKILNISYNNITELPQNLGSLKNLIKLNCSSNKLVKIPNTIGELNALTELNAQNNELIELPNEIFNLVNLINLNLYNNRLTKLSKGLGKLLNLKYIDLAKNPIDTYSALNAVFNEVENLNLKQITFNNDDYLQKTAQSIKVLENRGCHFRWLK